MTRLGNYIGRTLSFRLSLRVITALATLLIAALFVMYKMQNCIHQPEKMEVYAQRLVDNNPYIVDTHFIWVADSATLNTDIRGWIESQHQHEANTDAVTTFRLAIYGEDQQVVGMFDVDVSLTLLSKIVAEAKPSPNSFCAQGGQPPEVAVHPERVSPDTHAP